MAAGKGSRMKDYAGNKTLLPLVPGPSPYEGEHPILLHILVNLPPGPKALVINHRKEDVIRATSGLGVEYFEQPLLNGTGGALLAAKTFVQAGRFSRMIITMGDVPFVRETTYLKLVEALEETPFVVLGFCPEERKQYGVLETQDREVKRIIEWKYWREFPPDMQARLRICNSGIYAARKQELLPYLSLLEKHPHKVLKEREGKMVEIEEFFITDLVELMRADGVKVSYVVAEDEHEVMGLDDLEALKRAQELFRGQEGRVPLTGLDSFREQ